MCRAYSPVSSEKYAMRLPSGDQAGDRSAAPVVLVRLRASPFSAGTVTISPCTSKTARAPAGEIDAARMERPTRSKRGRTSGRSPASAMFTLRGFAAFRS